MKLFILGITGLLIGLDQGVKYYAKASFIEPLSLLGSWLQFRFVENSGVAFSFPLAIPLVKILALGFLVWAGFVLFTKKVSQYELWALMLIASGALGNLIDRFLNDGKVIDFVAVGTFPVFNLADSFITIGVGVYIWGELWKKDR